MGGASLPPQHVDSHERLCLLSNEIPSRRLTSSSILSVKDADVLGKNLNIGIDEYQSVVDEVQIYSEVNACRPEPCYPVHDPQVVALGKRSIYSLEAVAEITEKHGIKAAKTLTTGPGAVVCQFLVFSAAVITGAIHPLIYEHALWNAEKQQKETLFIPGTLYIIYYFFSVIAGNIISYLAYGYDGWKDCWNPKIQLYIIPSAAVLAFVETLDPFVLLYIHASSKSVISQLRLPLLALIGVFILKRRQTALQWVLILGITISIMGYSSVSINDMESAGVIGVCLCMFQSVAAAIGSTISEITFKRLKFPFPVQIAQARFLSLLISIVGLIGYCHHNKCFGKLFFYGWTRKVMYLVFWLILRDWVQTYTLKFLSALWKAMASALALCLTYVFQTIILRKSFDPILVSFILCVVVDIIGYSLTKRSPPPSAPSVLEDEENKIGK